MKPTNILFFFSNTLVGGAETNILKISKELHDRGFTIHFAVLEDNGPLLDNFEKSVYKSFSVIEKTKFNTFSQILLLNKIIIKNRIDYVSCFGLRVDLLVRIHKFIFFNSKHKIVSNIRASENWRKSVHALLDRITSSMVDQWVSNSIAGKKAFVLREKINPDKIRVIYNFIDIDESFSKNNEPIDKLKIGVLANYKQSKGHFNLIEISKLLSKKHIDHEFICAGYDYTNGNFLSKITDAKVKENFNLIGYISDKRSFFEKIDVLFLPSFIEGLPTSILEAMSYNIPIVCSDVDGLPEAIVNNKNGYICSPSDLDSFAHYLDLIRNVEIRKEFVGNGIRVLNEMFNKEKNMTLWVDVFSN